MPMSDAPEAVTALSILLWIVDSSGGWSKWFPVERLAATRSGAQGSCPRAPLRVAAKRCGARSAVAGGADDARRRPLQASRRRRRPRDRLELPARRQLRRVKQPAIDVHPRLQLGDVPGDLVAVGVLEPQLPR